MRAVLLVLAAGFASAPAADPMPPKVERLTFRVTGLFSPAREKVLRAAFDDLPDFKLIGVDFAEAEMTVEFAPAKLFPGQTPERVAELVNDKVRQATHHTLGVKQRRTVARDKLVKVEIAVSGCDCQACCLAAYEAVAAVEGVYQATASFKDGRVTALVDPTAAGREKLEAALIRRQVTVKK
jgi:copper chaperone CopZ